MNLICTCIFYSPIIPQAIPAALVGTTLNYWFSKYMLLRVHKLPDSFSALMAQFFANLMPIIILIWAFSFDYFIMSSKGINLGKKMIDRQVIKEEVAELAEVTFYIVLVFVLFPFRYVINKCASKDDNQANEEAECKYVDNCLKFPTDYDKKNPLTAKQGLERLINLQIDDAKKNGNEDQVKAL